MGILKKIARNVLPHYFVKKYQAYMAIKNFEKMPALHNGFEKINGAYVFVPWCSDASFMETYTKIKKHTLLEEVKSYVLWQLVKESTKLNDGAFLEVGVWRGGSGVLIAKQAEINGITNKVYLCDTFTGVVKTGKKDTFYKGGEHADTSKEIVEELLHKVNINNVKILVGIFPEESGKYIDDERIRFCHIDVDVYESTKDIFNWVWKKLVVGGIILFDDYGWSGCDGVTKFINEERAKKDRIVSNNRDGQAWIIKLLE
jgi:predicted O-methyltransferase YrrM